MERSLAFCPPEVRDIALELRSTVAGARPYSTERVLRRGLSYHDAARGGPVRGAICQIEIRRGSVRSAGLIGSRLRFHRSAGLPGRLGLALSVAGSAGLIVSMVAQLLSSIVPPEVEQVSWVNCTAWVGSQCLMIGYVLFGIDALRHRLLPRWNVLPLLLGSTVVFIFTHDMFGVPAVLPLAWETPLLQFALTGTCWAMLGVALMD